MKRPSTSAVMKLACLKAHNALVFCAVCRRAFPLDKIEYDHHHALVHGGEHCAETNLRPLCEECHKVKTKADVQANAKVKRIIKKRDKHPRERPPLAMRRKIPSRPMR